MIVVLDSKDNKNIITEYSYLIYDGIDIFKIKLKTFKFRLTFQQFFTHVEY